MLLKSPLFLVLAAGLVSAGGVVPARAANCAKAVRKAEGKLRKEVLKHGQFSPLVRFRRHQLEAARERCGLSQNFRDREPDTSQNQQQAQRRKPSRNDDQH